MILGSDATSYYSEFLHGDAGADTVHGFDGDDFIDGDAGNDTLNGGAGDDYLDGDIGDDIMTGGSGDDSLDGNDGRDYMSGGDGDDEMNGGGGADVMCGDNHGANGDYLNDGDTVSEDPVGDMLWANSGSPDVDYCAGGSSNTKWDGNAGSYCTGRDTIATRPVNCP